MRQKEKKEVVKILVTGDVNYNNSNQFIKTMQSVIRQIDGEKIIGTYGELYGAELLANAFALQKQIQYKVFNTNLFKRTKMTQKQAYWTSLQIGVKWADLILIFSKIKTEKFDYVMNSAKRKGKQYILRK